MMEPQGPALWSPVRLWAAALTGFAAALVALGMMGIVPLGRMDHPFLLVRADTAPGVALAIFDTAGRSHAQRSRFVLTEDGRALGPRSDVIDETRRRGQGAYSVWRGTVWFTAREGGDPLSNGRVYRLTGPWIPAPWVLPLLLAAAGALLLAAAPGRRLPAKAAALSRAVRAHGRTAIVWLDRPAVAFIAVQAVLLATTPWKTLIHWTGDSGDVWRAIFVAVVVVCGIWWKARDLPVTLRAFYRVGLALFVLAATTRHAEWTATELIPGLPNLVPMGALAALAWFRPIAALPAMLFYAAEHDAIVRMWDGLLIDALVDWQPVLELYIYFFLSIVIVALVRAVSRRAPPKADPADVRAAFLVAGAVHFANYFYSAVEKMRLEGGPFAWLIENETYRLATTAVALGVSPVGSLPVAAEAVAGGWERLNLAGNAVTLGTQLAAVAAAGFPAAAALLCVVFDLWHVVVAAFTGIFFWKWIALNVTLAAAYGAMTGRTPWSLRIAATLMVVAAPTFFSIAKLGWYDTPGVNALRIVAQTRDGQEILVPSDFFRVHSFQFVASAIWTERMTREFMPTDTWGTTKSLADKARADRCEPGALAEADPAGLLKPQTAAVVRRRHADALQPPTRLRLPSDRLYPHHVFSDPFGYAAFDRLDLRTVVRYRIDVQALCVNNGLRPPTVVRSVTALVVDVAEP